MLVVLQLGLIAATAVAVVARLPIWAFADERAHAAYVVSLAGGRLPLLAFDGVQRELVALGSSAAGPSYEAFQPPLYYAASAVPWAVWHKGRFVPQREIGRGRITRQGLVAGAGPPDSAYRRAG